MDTILTYAQLLRLFHKPLHVRPRRWLDMNCLDGLRTLRQRKPDDPALQELRLALKTALHDWEDGRRQSFVRLHVCDRPEAWRKEKAFAILTSIFGYVFQD